MIIFENTEVLGWEHAIRGMRNPLNSWEKSDSRYHNDPVYDKERPQFIHDNPIFNVGPNDLNLMRRLRNNGTADHRKFMRMIVVYVDITAPLYWWKEFDTYKVGTVANSCSTMHKIHVKEFTLGDFSHEHLVMETYKCLEYTIKILNGYREIYLQTKDKKYWWQMIQLLPSSYNQKRTVMCNYEVLCNMYKSRRNHKLDCWHTLCDWIEELPYSELITGIEKTPSVEDLDALLEKVKEVDERVATYTVSRRDGMSVLDFVDKNSKILWSFDLNRVSLVDVFDFIKEQIASWGESLCMMGV